jgi:hypothetical protein
MDHRDEAIQNRDEYIAKLRAALKPFAKLLDEWEDDGDTPPIRPDQQWIEMNLRVSDLRRARSALK